MLRTRRAGVVLNSLLLLLLVTAGWVGWQAYRVNAELSAAAEDSERLQTAVQGGRGGAAREALDDLREHTSAAADRTSGPTWAALGVLPGLGDDADGVALVSDVLADLSADGVEPLLSTTDRLPGILPRDATVDLAALEALRAPVAAGRAAFVEADERLEEAEPGDFVGRLAVRFRELAARVADARGALDAAGTTLEVMPAMLGAEGPRDHLLVFQNNAEVRATGGLPGAVSVLHAEDGRLELTRQVAGNAFGRRATPVLPLTEAERALFGLNVGRYLIDANLTPDFPRAAELMRARWVETQPEEPAGVLSVDPVALSYILGVTGPVEVDGVTLTADNAVEELLHRVYVRLPEPAAQDDFFRQVARVIFDRVSDGVTAPEQLVEALTRGAREGRLLVRSFDEGLQDELEGTTVSGELPSDAVTDRPQVGVYLNDTTVGKMSYFLRHDARVTATSCAQGRQRLEGTLRLRSTATEATADLPTYITGGGQFGTAAGSQLVVAYLYGPVGGSIDGAQFNGRPLEAEPFEHEGRPVVRIIAELAPGEVADVAWRMTAPGSQTGPVELRTTPSIEPIPSRATFSSAC